MNARIVFLGCAVTALAAGDFHHFFDWHLFACGSKGECQTRVGTPDGPAMLHTTDAEPVLADRGGKADPGWLVTGTATFWV